ncbi:enoyl-CoA hydratase/isomerase family protein [Streptomyces mexicanus]|uniref:Enoyl-CoA hydratase/isomerase family protein n=1 Tax=Streptomyces mexicanus TaxID=178566 RepID=A0A7X1LPX9_9ACTN|nr:enoyl-CoA hydratase-related protein [Streptomyces mexicanus]MBC2864952.1 enoyl-CoA hydratase/isomerase family protein [Streptomyces mexicanus]
MSAEVLVRDVERHREITINRPKRRNALTVEVVDALVAAVRGAEEAGMRSIVLTGTPPAFCAGGDLPSLSALASQGSAVATDAIYTSFHGLVRALRDSPLPAIAAVSGPAFGAGLDLALCCDLRIAAPDALFESTWIKAGLVPGMGGAHHLPALVGGARAAQMLLLGQRLDAASALACGLVGEVAEEDLAARATEVAESLADLPRLALARTKASLRRYLHVGLDSELAVMGAQQGQLLVGEEFLEATAQLTGRRPVPAGEE